MNRSLVASFVLLAAISAPAQGQSTRWLRFGFTPPPIEQARSETSKHLASAMRASDHRVIGGVIGGLIGVLFVGVSHGFSENDSPDFSTSMLDFAKILAAIGIGALIGSGIPKSP